MQYTYVQYVYRKAWILQNFSGTACLNHAGFPSAGTGYLILTMIGREDIFHSLRGFPLKKSANQKVFYEGIRCRIHNPEGAKSVTGMRLTNNEAVRGE